MRKCNVRTTYHHDVSTSTKVILFAIHQVNQFKSWNILLENRFLYECVKYKHTHVICVYIRPPCVFLHFINRLIKHADTKLCNIQNCYNGICVVNYTAVIHSVFVITCMRESYDCYVLASTLAILLLIHWFRCSCAFCFQE